MCSIGCKCWVKNTNEEEADVDNIAVRISGLLLDELLVGFRRFAGP